MRTEDAGDERVDTLIWHHTCTRCDRELRYCLVEHGLMCWVWVKTDHSGKYKI